MCGGKTLNYLNLVAYIVNVAITFGIGLLGSFFDLGLPSIGDQSLKYQTLITPASYAFAIWAVIFIAQAIFTLVQLFPSFAGTALVQNGVSYNYIGVVAMQVSWVLAFVNDAILLSEVFILGVLFFLVSIVVRQYNIRQPGGWREYWLLKFPFTVHCGWITVASLLNTSVLLVSRNTDTDIQFYVAIASLAAVLAIASFLLIFLDRTDFVIPLVLAWAGFGIFVELRDPQQLLLAWFGDSAIAVIQYGALAVSVIIVLAVLLKGCLLLRNGNGDDSDKRGRNGNSRGRWSSTKDEEHGYTRTDDKGRVRGGWFR